MQVSASQTPRLTQLISVLVPDLISWPFILKRRFAGCVPAFISPLASLMASIDCLAESENSQMSITAEPPHPHTYIQTHTQQSAASNSHPSRAHAACLRPAAALLLHFVLLLSHPPQARVRVSIIKSKCRLFNSSPERLVLAYDAWCGVAHGCTRKLGMKICGKLDTMYTHTALLLKSGHKLHINKDYLYMENKPYSKTTCFVDLVFISPFLPSVYSYCIRMYAKKQGGRTVTAYSHLPRGQQRTVI